MIVTKLMGGLGNQMFQYAAGKSLAIKFNEPLFVDTSFLNLTETKNYTKRKLELEQLQLDIKLVDPNILASLNKSRVGKAFSRFFKNNELKVISESSRMFDSRFFNAGNNLYLNGFWQSELYFESCRNDLLKEFTPNYVLNSEATKILQNIQSENSISIHVRRGDYVTNLEAHQFHGLCSMNYYRTCIDFIKSKVENPMFYIFSDDLTWCRENFDAAENFTFVNVNSDYSSQDLFLMSYCKHNIIANSSYSWWSAWLNTHADKLVCAPANWFSSSNIKTDIYCKNWIKF